MTARVRIILWLLTVMAIALTLVSTVTRSILTTQVEGRISGLLSQEAREFANFVRHGRDPDTGRRFTGTRRLLQVHLQRQYTDTDEEILGIVGGAADPDVLRQDRRLPSRLPLHRDSASLAAIVASADTSGVLERPQGEIRWAKVRIDPGADGRQGTFVIAFHADRELAGPDAVFRLLLIISAVALLLMTGIGWVVAGRILAPVRLVRQTAAELTEQDLTRRIPVRGNDDIAALAETFNAMMDRLERAFATQRQFVDDAGHELRTPITIVSGHLEVMGDDPADRERTVRLVTDEMERMSRIVEDLLLLAKAERPDFIAPRPVQLAELTADVFMKVRALGERGWELAEVAEGPVLLDEQRVTQAMVQLAQNAVRHTAPGGVIKIGSRLLPDRSEPYRVELYVADRGTGVRPRDREAIFERFWRGGVPRGAHGSGAGLGLSIVKAIAEGHHGRVELRETPGSGATFVLRLPGGEPPEEDEET